MGFPIINIATYHKSRKRFKNCKKCHGKGYIGEPAWFGNKVCSKCNGTGIE